MRRLVCLDLANIQLHIKKSFHLVVYSGETFSFLGCQRRVYIVVGNAGCGCCGLHRESTAKISDKGPVTGILGGLPVRICWLRFLGIVAAGVVPGYGGDGP